MLLVQNGTKYGFLGENKIYIGREGRGLTASALANPFKIGEDGDRNEVIEKFRKWLWPQIKAWRTNGTKTPAIELILEIAARVKRNRLVILTCYCKPQGCHGDIIDRCIQWLIKEGLV
ncbi:MAG: DUF4326 domain-containing protein [Snowella sp.]|nr:DUF4326 domain-containing protein [Snowella sp.]